MPPPWGATPVLEGSSSCMCLLARGCSPGNHWLCQPASQQRHVAPGMSKHQPHFRAHTHPWHRMSALVSATGGVKEKRGDKSRPRHLPSEPSAASPEGANPCPLSLVHTDFKHLTGTRKRKKKVSFFPVSQSPRLVPSYSISILTSKFPLFCWRSERGHHQAFDRAAV